MNALDMNTLPKSTPVSVRHLIAELVDQIQHLQGAAQAQADAQGNRAIAATDEHIVDDSVFDRVNVRTNQYGEVLNCRISEDCERLNLRVASKALGRTLTQNHSKVRTDRHGRKWIDFYAATSAAPANIMEQPEAEPESEPEPKPEPTVANFDEVPF